MRVEIAMGSAAAISKVALSNGHCINVSTLDGIFPKLIFTAANK